ncbi:hypothetical protein ACFO0S_00830 [Chryseomicrobium palamuruense]|uniref:DUF998 domain-containing protein n=1 Tax=Chryseomicrobium palamuruense TaxID=682973 RepID=A0ABV8USW6_9BACL
MIPTEWYIIGSLTMPSTWISILLSMALTAGAFGLHGGKQLASRVIDYFITFILVWKFSVILTDFKTIIVQPLSLLYFNGGLIGILLGTAVVIYMIFHDQKLNQLVRIQTISFIFGFYSISMVILNENTLFSELITLLSATLLILISWVASKFSVIVYLLIVAGFIFFTSIIQPLGVYGIMLWWSISMLILSYSSGKWMNRKELSHG